MKVDEKSRNTIILLHQRGITLSRISVLSGATPAMVREVLGQEHKRFPSNFVNAFTKEWNAMREDFQQLKTRKV